MSGYYDDDDRRYRSQRSSRRPVYEEEIIESRNARTPRTTDLVRRGDSPDSIEEIRRDYPPGEGGAYVSSRRYTRDRYGYAPNNSTRARSVGRSGGGYYADQYSDDDRGDRRRRRRDRDRRRARYDSDSDSESRSPPPRRERRKSFGEEALGAVGLTSAAAALAKFRGDNKERSRSRDRNHRARSRSRRGRYESDSDEGSRTRGRRDKSVDNRKKIENAAKAALAAGVIEAWRSRKEPGGVKGQGKRIFTAAAGAAGIDAGINQVNKGENPDKHGLRHTIEATIGGLAGNRLINGPRERSASRGRGRDDGRGGGGESEGSKVTGIASAAALAGLAGKAYQDYREKSRQRKDDRERDGYESGDSYDGREGRRRGGDNSLRQRSRSVSEWATNRLDKGLAAFGLGESNNHHDKYRKDQYGRRRLESDSEDDRDYRSRPRGGGGDEMVAAGAGAGAVAAHGKPENHSRDHSTCTDSYSSDSERNKLKKSKRKQMLTAGLATVATIHAAHNVHQSMAKREERHRKVMEGKMSSAEARRLKSRALMQDAASVGIAALGIKGAMSEWKEVKEERHEARQCAMRFEEMRAHRREKLKRQNTHSSEPDLQGRYQYDDPVSPRDDGYADGRGGSFGREDGGGRRDGRASYDDDYFYRQGNSGRNGGNYYYDGNPYGSYAQPTYVGGR